MDAVMGNLFYLFCRTWRAVLKMFARLFRIKQVKARKMFSRSCLQVGKTEKPIQKELLTA